MKLFKKNQVIIYIIALMLMTAGYLNYTTNQQGDSVETSMKMEANDTQVADIGDAKLVNSNDVITNETQNTLEENSTIDNNTTNTIKNETANTSSNSTNTENNTVETSSNNSNDYFTKSKLERDTMYSQMIETYEKVINSSNASETQKQSATQEITKINNIKNSIMICENLIKTKGFENSVVFVNGESISVIIGASELSKEQVAQVQNIISREMNAKIENIHIANK